MACTFTPPMGARRSASRRSIARRDGGDLAEEARQEALRCYRAAGIDHTARDEVERQIDGRARSGSSSVQSLRRGTGSIESDYLNGEILLLGRMHGIDTPVNRALARLARRTAQEGLSPGDLGAEAIAEQLERSRSAQSAS
jgi:2-dehydropantoate 2-reductase